MEYKKTPGGATIKGQQYEFGAVSLLYLRSLLCADTFLLGSNLDGFGKFDDVVLRLSWKGRLQVCFIQLKHRDKGGRVTQEQLVQTSGNYSLLKYYESYCAVEDVFIGTGNTPNGDIIRGVRFSDCVFVLFTNCSVEHKSKNLNKKELSIVETILSTGDVNEAIFSFGPEDDKVWRLREDCADNKRYQAFLSRIRIFSRQSHVDQLSQMLRAEVMLLAQVRGKDAELLYSSFTKRIEDWWNNENTFLTESSPQWYNALVVDMNANMVDKLQNIGYKFKQGENEYLLEKISTNALLNVTVRSVHSSVRCLKLFPELENRYRGRYLLITITDVERRLKQILAVCVKGFCDMLVVDMLDFSDTTYLTNILHLERCKVVVVSARKLKMLDVECCYHEDTWCLDQIREDSQERIMNCVVEFQGQDVRLSAVCDASMRRALGGRALSTLLRGNKLRLGSPAPAPGEFHIPRTLRHQAALREDVLRVKHDGDLFAVSGFPLGGLGDRDVAVRDVCDFVLADTERSAHASTVILSYATSDTVQRSYASEDHYDRNKYLDLCNKYKDMKNVHWVIYEDGFLVWKESCGSESTPTQYRSRMSSSCVGGPSCCHAAGLLGDWEHRLLLITGEPGMGKSHLLHYVAEETKQRHPASWVVHIALNDFTRALHDMPADSIVLQHVVNILLDAAHVDESTCPELARALLLDSLEHNGSITILLDAVDEVSPTYMEQVLRIVQLLLKTQVSRLWVTSRTVLQEHLQRELSSLPLVLQPFTDDEQLSFLTQYFSQQLAHRNVDVEYLHKQAAELLKLIKLKGDSLGRHICDVPLHARMVADTIKELVRDVPDSSNYTEMFSQLNLLRIYESFFDGKQTLYYEKYGVDETKSALIGTTQKEKLHFMEFHMKCALYVILTPEECNTLNVPNLQVIDTSFLEEIGTEKIGIIDGTVNGKPKFVHFTFCEYLAAVWFKFHYEKIPDLFRSNIEHAFCRILTAGLSSVLQNLLSSCKSDTSDSPRPSHFKVLLEDRLVVVRLFFDQMLCDGSALHEAVLGGSSEQVRATLAGGAAAERADRGGRLALHLAAAHGHSEAARLLLEAGSPVGVPDSVLGWSPLRYADRVGAWDVAVQLLQHGASDRHVPVFRAMVNDERVWRSYIAAVRAGHTEVTSFFGEKGANFVSHKSSPALILAALAGHSKVVKLLLQIDVDVNGTDGYGNTALHIIARRGDLNIMHMLLSSGANVHIANSAGDTALTFAAWEGHNKVVQLLVKREVEVNCSNAQGKSPLQFAAQNGHLDTVHLLLSCGADVHISNREGNTALMFAAQEGHNKIVQLLIKHDVDLNCANAEGNTSLHFASQQGQLDTVRALLASGADVHMANNEGDTALTIASRGRYNRIVQLLIKHQADVNSTNINGDTPLHYATMNGDLENVRLFLASGADVNVSYRDGSTALILATRKGLGEIVQLLIDHKADVNFCDEEGNRPLHYAAKYGHLEIVQLLLASGADVHLRNRDGQTAMALAVRFPYNEAVQLLRQYEVKTEHSHAGPVPDLRADPTAELESGLTVLLESGLTVPVPELRTDSATELESGQTVSGTEQRTDPARKLESGLTVSEPVQRADSATEPKCEMRVSEPE